MFPPSGSGNSRLICQSGEESRTTPNGPTDGGRSGLPGRHNAWQLTPERTAGLLALGMPFRPMGPFRDPVSTAGGQARRLGGGSATTGCPPRPPEVLMLVLLAIRKRGRPRAPIGPSLCAVEPACQECALSPPVWAWCGCSRVVSGPCSSPCTSSPTQCRPARRDGSTCSCSRSHGTRSRSGGSLSASSFGAPSALRRSP